MPCVSDIMTSTVYSLRPDDSLAEVRELMRLAKVRHTPVADDDGNFIGIITNRDLLECTISRLAGISPHEQDEIDLAISVAEVMNTSVAFVSPTTKISEAGKILLEHKYGCLPVLEGTKLVGILTEADFIKFTLTLLND